MPIRRYKSYFREDNAVVPRTTQWRNEQGHVEENMLDSEISSDESDIESNCEDILSSSSSGSMDMLCNFNPGIDNPIESSDEDNCEILYSNNEHSQSSFNEDRSSVHSHCSNTVSDNNTSFDDVVSDSSFDDAVSDSSFDDVVSDSSFDDSDGGNDFGCINGGDELIYEGASLTGNQSLLLLMAFVLKHHLTDQALDDFLSIMNMHLPNVVPETKYLFYKKFNNKSFTQHFFCPDCSHYFGPIDSCDPVQVCSCPEPKSVATAKSKHWYFSYWKVQSQLELLLEYDVIAGHLLNRIERDGGCLQDCTDGKMHKNLNQVYGYGPNDVSLLWNVDGVPVFRSSSRELWPIQCTLLELPYEMRKHNIIMPALWFSTCKVDMTLLLHPFVQEIELLSTEGFLFKDKRIRVFAPICTADAPARPKVRNTKQFNGQFGCDWCLHPGTRVARGKGHSQVYPYQGPQEERTHQSMEKLAIEAVELRSPQYGVKGPSVLSYISHFDLINGFVPDFLHCALLGVARQLTSLWFDSVNHDGAWYIGQPAKQQQYDKLLKGIVAPKEVRRLPRSITAREHWKGNEYKTFVLYYSLIVLQDLLPQSFLNHYFLFVWSLHKLLGTSITPHDLAKVGAVLSYFGLKMEELYGIGSCTFNVHQLVHLAKSTEMCGPLWAVSTFLFESNNGTLKKMVQGTQYVPNQICGTYAIMKSIPLYMKQCAQGDERFDAVIQKLVFGKSETKKAVQLDHNLLALSKPKVRKLSQEEMIAIRVAFGFQVNPVVYEYNRFILDGNLYDTAAYTRSCKRQNCLVKAVYQGNSIHFLLKSLITAKNCVCQIQHHEECDCQKQNVLLCMPFQVLGDNLYKCSQFNIISDFMAEVAELPEVVVALPLHTGSILIKCVKVIKGQKTFVVDMPNMIEME